MRRRERRPAACLSIRDADFNSRFTTVAGLLLTPRPAHCYQVDLLCGRRAAEPDSLVAQRALRRSRVVGDAVSCLRSIETPNCGAARQPVTLLNLWVTFCAPCIAEFPALDSLHQRYKDRGLRVLAVSVENGDAQVRAFLMAHPIAIRIGRDPTGTLTAALANESLPQTVLISEDGRVLFWSDGFGNEIPPALIAAIDSSLRAP